LFGEEGADMKCNKCGFVGFDHLSQCKKCGADLTAIRDLLGFSAQKSEVPSLLGTLLSDRGKAGGLKTGAPSEGDFPKVGDMPEIPDLELSLDGLPELSDSDLQPDRFEKEEPVLQLSDADLEDLAKIGEIPPIEDQSKNE